ncbi:MAG: Eco57I restriction-modification methylase domain-containing protein, partial [Monoglobales bacterium]
MFKPSLSINKTYRQIKVTTEEFSKFQNNLTNLFHVIDENESEENTKTHLMDFLKNTYFFPEYLVAQKGRIDFVIHSGHEAKSPVALLFEVKKPNNTSEMISVNNLNKKALQELLLYYLRERVDDKNTDLKYLVVTNIYEFYIFDAQEFERLFYSNSKLIKEYKDFSTDRKVSSNTDFFYKEIAGKYIEDVKEQIEFTYFDIRTYEKWLNTPNSESNKKLIELYKIFSPTHLLKLSFQNDSNSLNKNFYNELLHIIGLEEVSIENKKIIKRKSEKNREDASLIENTINILDAEDRLDKISNLSSFGENRQEQLFNVALQLNITWINRILFLKLLESQLIKYHKGNKKLGFLNVNAINDYDELNRLFFQVLARQHKDRTQSVQSKYKHVPYLNSSLFEISDLEYITIVISNLSPNLELSLFSGSVLKDKKNKPRYKQLSTLHYLFEFLEAYDFSSEGSEEVQVEAKTLISASVLGLIFEKINGHKDGAVFTPGFVTMYMCRQAIERTIIQKFNTKYSWNCESLVDLYNKIDNIVEANEIINSLKICDPAVGSGHFLVSALNEIIQIKYELGILVDKNGKRIRQNYSFEIINDELIISDDEGDQFSYIPKNQESQRIQETLFHEKQTIIENCLFGVDINPNSVNICRLRLWIELLKNAYYTKESDYTDLETLPNIDINIKCGNSLLSRFDVNTDLKQVLKQSDVNIAEYKNAVAEYKNAPDKESKKKINQLIDSIKSTLKTEIAKNDTKYIQLSKKRGQIINLEAPELFELTAKEKKAKTKEIEKLKIEVKKFEDYFKEIETNKIYLGAFEWRFEFPEVLDNVGNFMGFDCIIGNPPYIQLQKMGKATDALALMNYQTFVRTGDIYCLFYELGYNLLNPKGILCFITSNKWLRAGYGEETRRFFAEKTNPIQLIDFAGTKIFDSATVDVNILLFSKEKNAEKTQACVVKNDGIKNLSVFIRQNASEINFNSSNSWIVLSPIEQRIKKKIELAGIPLKDWNIQINYGIKTGFNDAFIVNGAKRKELIEQDPKSDEIIRP